jgi:hypothetical protein
MTAQTVRASLEDRIALHKLYWDRKSLPYLPASFRVGDYFVSREFEAAKPLLVQNKKITPEMLSVEDFVPDYERMFAETEELGQDGFWTAEPFTGIPWMEAILGCEISANEESFSSKPWMTSLEESEKITVDPANPWLLKYLEFTQRLVELGRGRFTVGMPIMRGPSDMVGAIMGQTEMIYALADEPEKMKKFFFRVTEAFLSVLQEQQKVVPPFHGGSCLGFYHVYCPGPSIWFQDDLAAILSPEMYGEFLDGPARLICRGREYTAVHLHPASFFTLNHLLANEELKAIQVNKDVGGPSVEEMLPYLKRIIERKNLILWGDYSAAELDSLRKNLPARGVFFNFMMPNLDRAREILTLLRS